MKDKAQIIQFYRSLTAENFQYIHNKSGKIDTLLSNAALTDEEKRDLLAEFLLPNTEGKTPAEKEALLARSEAARHLLGCQDHLTHTTPLHCAASLHLPLCVQFILSHYPELYEQKSGTGLIALHYGASCPEITNYLCSEIFEGMHEKYINEPYAYSDYSTTLLEDEVNRDRPNLAAIEALLIHGARTFRDGTFLWEGPPKAKAPQIAELLERYGVNPLRPGTERKKSESSDTTLAEGDSTSTASTISAPPLVATPIFTIADRLVSVPDASTAPTKSKVNPLISNVTYESSI